MTYTKLIERLRKGQTHEFATGNLLDQSVVMDEAADAIESMQAENAGLRSECAEHKENAMRNARIAVSIRAERDQLQAENEQLEHEKHEDSELWRKSILEREQQISALQSQLDAMGKGEPRFWYDEDMGELYSFNDNKPVEGLTPLYAAPEALAPTVLKPFTPCVCHDDAAKRFCKDKGKCMYFEAHGIHAKGGQHEDA